jgi:hypothetical protein
MPSRTQNEFVHDEKCFYTYQLVARLRRAVEQHTKGCAIPPLVRSKEYTSLMHHTTPFTLFVAPHQLYCIELRAY